MNIDNVVMVRAMSHLPLNGELIPSCEGVRLEYEKMSDFNSFLQNVVEQELEKQLGRPLNLYYESPDALLRDKILTEYRILKGAYYTSTLSFSLNGIVPDDNTCEFSKLPIAVIDPIKNHQTANFVNINQIDTTIKGRLKVSPDAILVIDEDLYNSLNDDIKMNLASNYKIELFKGDLKTAINNTLHKYNYPSLSLSDRVSKNYIEDCEEKESMLNFIDEFAKIFKLSKLRLDFLYRTPKFYEEENQIAHDKVNDDFYDNLKVEKYYKHQLYRFLITKADNLGILITDEEKIYLFTERPEGKEAMERITFELINAYGGLENFKSFINEYNEFAKNNYLTNDEIIRLNGDTRK